jgi:hypothetical protein
MDIMGVSFDSRLIDLYVLTLAKVGEMSGTKREIALDISFD